MRNICAFTTLNQTMPDFFSLNEKDDGKIILTTRHGGVHNEIEVPFDQVETMHRYMSAYLEAKRQEALKTELPHIQV